MNNKRVLITGAAGSLGSALAKLFIDAGFHVYGLDKADAFKDDHILDRDRRLTITLEAPGFVSRTLQNQPDVDILINAAGIRLNLITSDYEANTAMAVFQVNAYAPLALAAAYADRPISTLRRVVHVASAAGIEPSPDDLIYGMSKAALIHGVRGLANEFPKVVNLAIAPPLIQGSNMAIGADEDVIARWTATTPTGTLPTVDEVAAEIFWLATEAPADMSGTCFGMNRQPYKSLS